MSHYTTGEIAKLCAVTVRTVQYYDTRGLLAPSALTDGGRRLYSDADLERLRIICFLRNAGLPIDAIRRLFAEENPETVIGLILAEQKAALEAEIDERREQLAMVESIAAALRTIRPFTVESIGDIAHMMKDKHKLRRARICLTVVGLLLDAIEVSTLMIGILRGVWWPFAVGMTVAVIGCTVATILYFGHTAYLCPACHKIFRPSIREALFAHHTPRTRKLHCPSCGHRGFCVELYAPRKEKDRAAN